MDYLTIVIIIEVFLLLLIVSKLAYDARQYRHTGQLPWLARHICLEHAYAGLKLANQHDWHSPPPPHPPHQHQLSIESANATEAAASVEDDGPANLDANRSIFWKCFQKSGSSQSSSSSAVKNGVFSLQEMGAFRPRRWEKSAFVRPRVLFKGWFAGTPARPQDAHPVLVIFTASTQATGRRPKRPTTWMP